MTVEWNFHLFHSRVVILLVLLFLTYVYFYFGELPLRWLLLTVFVPPLHLAARAAYISILRRRWGCTPARSPVLASGCHGRTSRGVTVTITMRPTPGA